MNHVFRILSILALLIFSLEVSAFAQETGFLTPGKSTFLYLNTKEMNVNYDNESLKFVMLQNGTLKLMSRDDTTICPLQDMMEQMQALDMRFVKSIR